jgi:acetyltransferase-like isoleucine patch superfamily enzyme
MITDKPRFPIKAMILHGWLPSFLKCALYRMRGYRIGRNVQLSFGVVICDAKEVTIGDDVSIGFFSFIRGREVKLGDRVRIGMMCFLDTPHLEIGSDTKLNEQVYVGGLQFPDSKLKIGRNCQIMQMTFINPTKGITIGDDTGIGGDCLLFGHSSWLSRFEGYPVDFRPIEIGNSVSIAWRVFIGAGAKIGDGAVVGANSFVNHTIPPACLATGSPAKVVARAPYFPRRVGDAEKEKMLQSIVDEMLGYWRGSGLVCRQDADKIEVTWEQRRETVQVATTLLNGELPQIAGGTSVFVSLRNIPDATRAHLAGRGVLWLDLERKERGDVRHALGEEVAQYLRRHGVRFNRAAASGAAASGHN